jgi:hypothetical protein
MWYFIAAQIEVDSLIGKGLKAVAIRQNASYP